WSRQTTVERLGMPIVSAAEDTVYLCSGSGRLLALHLRTGEELWQTAPHSSYSGSGGGMESSQVLRLDGSIVGVASDATLFSIDPRHPDAKPVDAKPVDAKTPGAKSSGSGTATKSAKPTPPATAER
ncbi:hypothetical protein AB4212_61720, partial [Streptomyces sp. 2MCAF27]